MSSNVGEIIAVANTLLSLFREFKIAVGPGLEAIKTAQAEGRDVTVEELDAASEREDAARKRAEAAIPQD